MTVTEALAIRMEFVRYLAEDSAREVPETSWKSARATTPGAVAWIGKRLFEAEITVWDVDLFMTAIRGSAEAFEGTLWPAEQGPQSPQLWLFPEDIILGPLGMGDDPFELGEECFTQGVMVAPISNERLGHGMNCSFFFRSALDGRPRVRPSAVHRFDDPLDPGTTPYVAACEFLKLPYVHRDAVHLPRAERRRLEREARRPLHESPVKTVVLRRAAPMTPREGNPDPSAPLWTCQWAVRGHWRRQWYPSSGEHKPKWVEPYVKGPDDKPFRAPSETVFVAKR